VCPLSVTNSLCRFDSNKVAILACLCNETAEGDTLTIGVGDHINEIRNKLRVAIETVGTFGVALEDHLNITFLLNVQVVDSTGLFTGEGAEHGQGCGCVGHGRFGW